MAGESRRIAVEAERRKRPAGPEGPEKPKRTAWVRNSYPIHVALGGAMEHLRIGAHRRRTELAQRRARPQPWVPAESTSRVSRMHGRATFWHPLFFREQIGAIEVPSKRNHHCDAVALTKAITEAFAVLDIHRLLDTDIAFCCAWVASMSHELQAAMRWAELMSLRAARLLARLE